jgi:hypothetical protein
MNLRLRGRFIKATLRISLLISGVLLHGKNQISPQTSYMDGHIVLLNLVENAKFCIQDGRTHTFF